MDAINFNLKGRNNGFLNNLYRAIFKDYMGFCFEVVKHRQKKDYEGYWYQRWVIVGKWMICIIILWIIIMWRKFWDIKINKIMWRIWWRRGFWRWWKMGLRRFWKRGLLRWWNYFIRWNFLIGESILVVCCNWMVYYFVICQNKEIKISANLFFYFFIHKFVVE